MGANPKLNPADTTTPSKETYFPLPIHTYNEGDIIDQKLYFKYQGQFVFFQEKGQKWLSADSKRLKDFGLEDLYIRADSLNVWHEFMDSKMPKLLQEPKMSMADKGKIIYQTCVSTAEAVFNNPKSSETAQKSTSFLKHCIDFLSQDKSSFYELFKTSALTMSEHSHGLHVAAYAVTLGKKMGFTKEQELVTLGVGALLHDLGKTKISPELLDRKGPISDAEKEELKKHAKYGYEIVSQYGTAIPQLAKRIIVEHHERIDGSGYPKGLTGGQIHIFSQIVGVCDVFDSMTSHRPYKDKASPFDSVSEMLTLDQNKFDKNLLVAFIEMMKP